MQITFGSATTFRNCTSKPCGIGKIRHAIGQAEENGKHYLAYQCVRCKRTVTEEVHVGAGEVVGKY